MELRAVRGERHMKETMAARSASRAHSTDRRCGRPLLARLLVTVCVAVAPVACAFADPEIPDPCAAENRTAAKQREALDSASLVLPSDATDVNFARSVGGMGDWSLTLAFNTTPGGLSQFLDRNKLPAPRRPSGDPVDRVDPLAAGDPLCDLDRGFTYSAIVREDTTDPGLYRSLAVDKTDAEAPHVLVIASVR